MSWSEVVAGRLEGLGFQVVPLAGGSAFERMEPWGRLWVLLAQATSPEEGGALCSQLAEEVARASLQAPKSLVALVVFPHDRLSHAEVEGYQALRQADPDGRWTLIPWVVEREAELVNQHIGWPSIDPRVAAALADPVVEERQAQRRRPLAEQDLEGRDRPAPGEQVAAAEWGRRGNRLAERLGLGGDFPITRFLMALNICVYLFMVLLSKDYLTTLLDGPDVMTLYHFGANNTYLWGDPHVALQTTFDQPWRLLTATFLHGSGLHIFFNMYSLWNVGRYVEISYGSRRTLYIYLTSGVIGSLTSVLLRTGPLLGVGASGAIMGLLGATIYFAYSLKGYRVNWGPLLTPVVLTLGYGFIIPAIDNWAHMGGLVGGVLAGFVAGAPGDRKSWKPVVAGALGALLLALLLHLIPLVPLLFNPKG